MFIPRSLHGQGVYSHSCREINVPETAKRPAPESRLEYSSDRTDIGFRNKVCLIPFTGAVKLEERSQIVKDARADMHIWRMMAELAGREGSADVVMKVKRNCEV